MLGMASYSGLFRLIGDACWLMGCTAFQQVPGVNVEGQRKPLKLIQRQVKFIAVLDLVDFHHGPIQMFRQGSRGHPALFPVSPDIAGKKPWGFGMLQSGPHQW